MTQEAAAAAVDVPPPFPTLPATPRPSTVRVRRRSWAELPVRIWMVLTVLIALVTVYFTMTRVREALNERWLIQNGTDVKARFEVVDGDPVRKRRPRNDVMACTVSFTLNGKPYRFEIRLEPKPFAFAEVGTELPIKVDPKDPEGRWTEETEPKPWAQELTVVGLLAPLLLLLACITLLKRRGMLRVWQDGELTAATVVETRHTAVAPLSRNVRFALRDGEDRRIFSTLVPTRAGIPQKGQTIWLLCPRNQPWRAVLADLYNN